MNTSVTPVVVANVPEVKPSSRQTTLAPRLLKLSSQTGPHVLLAKASSRPVLTPLPETSRTRPLSSTAAFRFFVHCACAQLPGQALPHAPQLVCEVFRFAQPAPHTPVLTAQVDPKS